MRIRIHFEKSGFACFVSHIDLPMLFGRAARRAGLSAEQTQGFSPHPKLALCPPLPIGVVGLREPADFWFESWDDDSLDRWQSMMPKGIRVLDGEPVEGVSLHKLTDAASYVIEPKDGVAAESVTEKLADALTAAGALREISLTGSGIKLISGELERCGPSFMVKNLVAAGLLGGWKDLFMVRTAVGRWDEGENRLIKT